MVKIINDVIIVFLMDLSFNNKEELEEKFKSILNKLEKRYRIEIKGSYKINVYKDKIYGIILEIRKDDIYYDYFNTADMNINIINSHFLYEVDDIYNINKNNDVYLYNNKIYIDIKDRIGLLKIIEYSKIIYKENKIIKNGKKINNML